MLEKLRDSTATPRTLPAATDWLRRRVLGRLAARWRHGFVTVVCPDGERWQLGDPASRERAACEVLDDRFFADLLFGGETGAGESFVDGRWRSPDLPALLRLFVRNYEALGFEGPLVRAGRAAALVSHRLRRNDRAGARRNVAAHYDLGNDFYRLFLDDSMAYSCAVYRRGDETLEEAQANKYRLIGRRLALSSRDHLLEIGSGWGGFAVFAARTYGCRVTTVTISERQLVEARARVRAAGLADRVEVRFADYRELEGRFDKIASIEMFEAVGERYFGDYFAACDRLLAPDGLMLLQTIAMPHPRFVRYRGSVDWTQKYIFPGCCIPSLEAMTAAMSARSSLTVHHLEDIGASYAPTLRAWRERLFARAGEARRLGFDERFLRTWHMYLSFSEASFAERTLFDLQLVLTRPRNRSIPAFEAAP